MCKSTPQRGKYQDRLSELAREIAAVEREIQRCGSFDEAPDELLNRFSDLYAQHDLELLRKEQAAGDNDCPA